MTTFDTRGQIAVIDPGTRVAEIDTFNNISSLTCLSCSYHLPAFYGCQSLDDLHCPPKALIILGSSISVVDDIPWQHELRKRLEKYLEKKTPMLGLCYGHQLLGHIFGAKIGYNHPDQRKTKGVYETSLCANPLWGAKRTVPLIYSHREQLLSIPAGFVTSASRPTCPIDGLYHKERAIWSFQAHPEATGGFTRNNQIPGAAQAFNRAYTSGHQLIRAFLEHIEKTSSPA